MARIYDYIVIGSGPGGGVVGYQLHKAGADVAILEAGNFFRKDTFPTNEADISAQLYWGGGIEFNKNAKMAFLRARVVGGTRKIRCLQFDVGLLAQESSFDDAYYVTCGGRATTESPRTDACDRRA